jgi:hypothetical protein
MQVEGVDCPDIPIGSFPADSLFSSDLLDVTLFLKAIC